jgi:amino acid adenylation domain-containing protein
MTSRPFLIHQLLLEAASRTPDAVALIDPKARLTYAELEHESLRAATALEAAGVGPGDLVGISMEKTATAIAAVYGILRRGAAYVPIDPAMPRARAELILAHTGLRTVITSADRVASFAESRAAAPRLEHAIVASGGQAASVDGLRVSELGAFTPEARAARDVTEGHLAYVLHTSGSTGQPKGVAISHRNGLAFVLPATERFVIGPTDRLACQAPLHFDLSVFDLYCAAHAGAGVVIFPEYYSAFPKKMSQAIAEHGVTIWNSVVSALALLVDKGKLAEHERSSLRAVIFSGERMPIPLLRRLHELLPTAKLFNVYGQTEANSSLVHEVESIPADDGAPLPLGRELPNFEVFLLGEGDRLVAGAGEPGELCVRAATVASGAYFRDAERSQGKFCLDPVLPESGMRVYRTGDLVRRDEHGDLFFVGRRDDMVKTRGYRVELGEIQTALDRIGAIAESAVLAIPNPSIGHELRAFVKLAPGATTTSAELAAELGRTLPPYMVPERIVVKDDLPRTSTGKIDKSALSAEPT